MKLKSCGYDCFLFLCQSLGVDAQINKALLAKKRQANVLSFHDFHELCEASALTGNGYVYSEKIVLPAIASMGHMDFVHFVVLLRYGSVVRYYEPNHGIRYLPRFLFDRFFTKYVFVVDCF